VADQIRRYIERGDGDEVHCNKLSRLIIAIQLAEWMMGMNWGSAPHALH